jgi:acyl-CoA hydrolase
MDGGIAQSEARMCRAIFPGSLNANETLFGGQVLKWMDELAYIAATRYTRQRMFTISVDKIKFLKAVEPGSIVELIASVEKADSVRLFVSVQLYAEEMYGPGKEKAVEATFILATLDEEKRPKRLERFCAL